jgi:transcription elongation factor Elf1
MTFPFSAGEILALALVSLALGQTLRRSTARMAKWRKGICPWCGGTVLHSRVSAVDDLLDNHFQAVCRNCGARKKIRLETL